MSVHCICIAHCLYSTFVVFSSFVELEIPSQISTETVVSYGKPLPCDKAAKASERLKAQMESTLQCARNKTCKVTVEAKGG